MKYFAVIFLFAGLQALAESSPVGRWKTIDDETHQAKSIVRIEEHSGDLEGIIETVFPEPGKPDHPLCDKCPGDLKDKPVVGMRIMWDMKKRDAGKYGDGQIMDPKNGKTYDCKLSLSDDGKELTVRGFIGISLLGRSQTWFRQDSPPTP